MEIKRTLASLITDGAWKTSDPTSPISLGEHLKLQKRGGGFPDPTWLWAGRTWSLQPVDPQAGP